MNLKKNVAMVAITAGAAGLITTVITALVVHKRKNKNTTSYSNTEDFNTDETVGETAKEDCNNKDIKE